MAPFKRLQRAAYGYAQAVPARAAIRQPRISRNGICLAMGQQPTSSCDEINAPSKTNEALRNNRERVNMTCKIAIAMLGQRPKVVNGGAMAKV